MADVSDTEMTDVSERSELSRKEHEALVSNAKLELIHTEYKAADIGNSTDDNVVDVLHDSEEGLLTPEAKDHYDNLSDSHHSVMDDEDEEEKIEQEIITRLSHLKINRNINRLHIKIHDENGGYPRDKWMDWNSDDNEESMEREFNDETMLTEDDPDNIRIDVGDEHYQSLMTTSSDPYAFNLRKEFLSNETFLKYAMLYATIYLVSKHSVRRWYDTAAPVDVDHLSRKAILICNATITLFKNHEIWNQPHRATRSPFKDLLTENESNFLDIQKAFYCVMLILSYFGGYRSRSSKQMTRKLSRFYNLVCIGCIILIKKYRKIGGLYIYTSFWMQLSSLFLHSSKVLKQCGLSAARGRYSKLMRYGGVSSAVMYALTMIYSRLFLFSKVIIPIIQNYYRNNNPYIGSIGSLAFVAFLLKGYYQIGDGFINALVHK
eukprot:302870_1